MIDENSMIGLIKPKTVEDLLIEVIEHLDEQDKKLDEIKSKLHSIAWNQSQS
jgi:hypothetical protein